MRETLIHGRVRIHEIWIAEGKKAVRIGEIIQIARERNIPVRYKKSNEIKLLLPGVAHQGIVAVAEKFIYSDPDYLIKIALQSREHGIIIAADHITDEGNLGALIRTAAFFGAHGLIIPKDRSAGVTPALLKRSSGACACLSIARVVNMARALNILEKKGFWIIGASGDADCTIFRFDWNRDLVLVLGNEQKGLSRSVRKCCHQIVGIPSSGQVESLNVAVAGGVVLAEILRQRMQVSHKTHLPALQG